MGGVIISKTRIVPLSGYFSTRDIIKRRTVTDKTEAMESDSEPDESHTAASTRIEVSQASSKRHAGNPRNQAQKRHDSGRDGKYLVHAN